MGGAGGCQPYGETPEAWGRAVWGVMNNQREEMKTKQPVVYSTTSLKTEVVRMEVVKHV
jgi:hypothetical protein